MPMMLATWLYHNDTWQPHSHVHVILVKVKWETMKQWFCYVSDMIQTSSKLALGKTQAISDMKQTSLKYDNS